MGFFLLLFIAIGNTFVDVVLESKSDIDTILTWYGPACAYVYRIKFLKTARLGQFFRDNSSLNLEQWFEQQHQSNPSEKRSWGNLFLSWGNLLHALEAHRLGDIEQRRHSRAGFPDNTPAHTLGLYLALTMIVITVGWLTLDFVSGLAQLAGIDEAVADLIPNALLSISNDVPNYSILFFAITATLTYVLLWFSEREPEVLNTKIAE